MSVFIELQNVAVELGGQPVLQDINLELQPGKITAILGNSGSGLSVLLKTAAGLIPATRGQVLYDDCNLDSFSERQLRQMQTRTGFVFQDAALWANMDLATNLDLPLTAKFPHLRPQERKQRIEAALQRYDFSVDTKKRPVDISQGQKKFVSFLRATIPEPEALFMDEPTSTMDNSWARKIKDELVSLRAKGTTLILAGNQYQPIFELADHLVILHNGRILDQGESDKMLLSPHPDIQSLLACRPVE